MQRSTHSYKLPATSSRGVTLIDTVVGTALLLVVFLGVAAAFNLSVDVVLNNKSRASAVALSNERMEYIRSLTYAQVGTVGGIPAGVVAPIETIALNGVTYTRRTFVQYADDPADGTGASDSNSITADYKIARVDVAWTARAGERHITIITRISPANGMETAVPGGTLTINVSNAAGQPLFNAQVVIVNASTSPAVNITTYTNASGTVSFIGAPAAAGYAVTVSKSGYSTAQTYAATSQNTNPNPGHLAVSLNQTTTGTFAIDLLGQKTIQSYLDVLTATSTDTFAGAAMVATSSNVTISGGTASLAAGSWGEVQSIAMGPSSLVRWKSFSWSDTQPSDTSIRYRVYDGGGTVLPDSQLPGNGAGFLAGPIDLSGVATSSYPLLRLDAVYASENASLPSIDSWSLAYDYGPDPLPNIAFNLKGAKTIGSGPSGTLYKTNIDSTTGGISAVTITGLEWDSYTVSISTSTSSYDLSSICGPQPESLPAGAGTQTRLYFMPHTTHSLLLEVHAPNGVLLSGATTTLSRTGFSATDTTDGCGQAFFGGLTSGSAYTIVITAPGYANYVANNVNISGATRLVATMN